MMSIHLPFKVEAGVKTKPDKAGGSYPNFSQSKSVQRAWLTVKLLSETGHSSCRDIVIESPLNG